MDEENSNDVVLIENTEGQGLPCQSLSDTRPLMSLFKRLISNDTKSNTVLTNAQILFILVKEFHMNISVLHGLEVDIYINIVKKFLKDWPQWDVFDRVINKLKKKGAHSEIEDILEQKYKHLREYLNSMIEIAKPLAKDAIKKLEVTAPEKPKEPEVSDIVLEIYCTRKMLNKFIYNQPNPNENNSLFNLVEFEPYKLNDLIADCSFSSMLHWYGVRLSIELPYFQFSRYTAHQLTHVLVNEANGPRDLKKELDTNVYMKNTKVITNSIPIDCIVQLLDKILQQYENKFGYKMIEAIFNAVKNDLSINGNTIEVPGVYKQHCNKHPYVRKLSAEVDLIEPQKNCLFIEETIIPIQDWHIGKFVNIAKPPLPNLRSWLKFECGECKQKFNGAEFMTLLRDHFKVYHMDEPDWTCTNCEKSFKMTELTSLGWFHQC